MNKQQQMRSRAILVAMIVTGLGLLAISAVMLAAEEADAEVGYDTQPFVRREEDLLPGEEQ